ncbi:septal ring lytic transglycosylase RlpA family protein [Patescibacteria group bacterium]|nr:septal ring lytic transglycosylase RlpA family protein [Patescibacteria group bacterium]MBU1682368.1 septal ring lytic transglycosylase RlpA family protein [Patescibacteria group bacterium]MBU1934840.1 septal ring lytic transglycosylase RlpA family protein [Patescibacteria group bacterium]
MSNYHKLFIAIIGLIIPIQVALGAFAFSDVSTSHPNYEAIMYLQENGTVEGYADGSFKPEQAVNRVEALKILLLGSDILVPEIQEQDIFPDVMHGSWYAKYVSKAKNLGIVKGDDDTGMFRPGDTVNLAEALKMMLETNDINVSAPGSNPHPDVPADSWYAPYFSYAASISLLDEGSGENVYPAQLVDRGLLAELMYRLSQKPEGYQEGQASYYGEAFHGKTTASGAVFDASGYTAAHLTYPFGTWLKVTNLENNEYVYVEVTDRGPYVEGRILDLSQAAFEHIASLSRGVITVSIVPENPPAGWDPDETSDATDLSADLLSQAADCPEKDDLQFLSKTTYDNITLDGTFPDTYLEGEVLVLTGTTSSSTSTVSAFLIDEDDEQYSFSSPAVNNEFKISVFFPYTGTFRLGILPGESGSSVVEDIEVLENNCIAEGEDTSLVSPSGLDINLEEGETVIDWSSSGYDVFKLTFIQDSESVVYFLYNSDEFTPYYRHFEDFDEDDVDLYIQGSEISGDSILQTSSITWSDAASISFDAVVHYEYIIQEDEVEVLDLPDTISTSQTFEISVDPKTTIDAEGAIILPNGQVEQVQLDSPSSSYTNANGIEVFSASASELNLSYRPTSNAIHFAEINNADGLAVLNIPLYPGGDYPLLPNPVELASSEPASLGSNLNSLRNQMLTLVNADRQDHGLGSLTLDSSLSQLAQYRSDDMVNNDYFSHWDESGMSANDIRKNYAIGQVVAENIAKDTTLELAEYGLMRSALHRANILSDEWTRAGFGITQASDGSYIFVQIFSADPIDLSDLSGLRNDILSAINANKAVDYTLQSNLNNIAQDWSGDMVDQDFFDFNSPGGDSLIDNIHNAGITASLGTYIVGNTSYGDAKEQIAENEQILESTWVNLGLGIEQDSFGVIKITLIYTE